MRARAAVCVLVALAAVVAAAGDDSSTSAYWDVRCSAPGFASRTRLGGDAQVLAGAVDGVAVEASVLEGDAERDAAAWLAELVATWKNEGRALPANTGADANGLLCFTDAGLGGAPRRHAVRVVARGVHGFVLHAVGKPGDDEVLRKALAGFEVGNRIGASIRGAAMAREQHVDPSDPRLTLAALEEYVQHASAHPAVAAEIATSVLCAPGGNYSADDLWGVCTNVALAYLQKRELPAALEWLDKARVRSAATTEPAQSLANVLYNTACAHALAGDRDKAFGAISDLVTSGAWAGFAEWAAQDDDLASLRDDPRWAKLPKAEGK